MTALFGFTCGSNCASFLGFGFLDRNIALRVGLAGLTLIPVAVADGVVRADDGLAALALER